jgi:hypothetical protein
MTWQEYMQQGRQEVGPKTLCVKMTAQEFAIEQKKNAPMYPAVPLINWKPSQEAVDASKKMLEEQELFQQRKGEEIEKFLKENGQPYKVCDELMAKQLRGKEKSMNNQEFEVWKEKRIQEMEEYFGDTREELEKLFKKNEDKPCPLVQNTKDMRTSLYYVKEVFTSHVEVTISNVLAEYWRMHKASSEQHLADIKKAFDKRIKDLRNDIYVALNTCLGLSLDFCKDVKKLSYSHPVYSVMSKTHTYMDVVCDYKYRASLVPGCDDLLGMATELLIVFHNVLVDVEPKQWAKIEKCYRERIKK